MTKKDMIPIDEKTGVPAEIPAWMQEDVGSGLEDIQQYLRPSAVKVKQAMSKDPYKSEPDGTLFLTPDATVIAKPGESIFFVPVYHQVEYLKTNPIGAEQFVAEKTTDPKSELALKCQDAAYWKMPDGIRHSESHNFVVFPWGPSAQLNDGDPFLLRFWRGSYKEGMMLLQLLRKRRKHQPIFGCVFEAHSIEKQDSNKNDFWVLKPSNPAADSGVSSVVTDPDAYALFKAFHEEARARGVDVDYESPEEDTGPVVDEANAPM